jgi:hypothetical protein
MPSRYPSNREKREIADQGYGTKSLRFFGDPASRENAGFDGHP